MRNLRDRIRGVIFGTAIGDSCGYQCEFDKSVQPVSGLHPDGLFSDDTQMLLATVQGLLRAKTWGDMSAAAEEIAEEYVAWLRSPENNRAPGNACLEGCANLALGIPWSDAGKHDAKGCGAAMRSMAYGMWFQNPYTAATWAAEHAKMTHNTTNAMASAAAVAAAVVCAIRGDSPPKVFQTALKATEGYDAECHELLLSVVLEWGGKPPDAVLDRFRGWRGDEAVAASLWCLLRHPDNYQAAVLTAVNSPGDSDSLGAITGAIMGARLGASSIPQSWVGGIEARDFLDLTSNRLLVALEGHHGNVASIG